mmetsp:Transcript_37457/g.91064  ORF Transcript_37457/g.91064 Transcript_37457/m.91064 type:complete len:670 (-) Transcript_37457:126-2135(-)|eukprot:CAMPEP_0113456666 /NCGR_PEP_ID=MMETSP0014_2-20120614/9006_1 /TAXON_ID=2857 /ORGANISM="Nitzschia sp." /LENGTH=669 /DNA_ID=CAMNT_0000348129 /DNA_START=182 /DNA_END=2191 /DNA_ORIENTATION=+ /assembly_acc=CAM_ASM_000159
MTKNKAAASSCGAVDKTSVVTVLTAMAVVAAVVVVGSSSSPSTFQYCHAFESKPYNRRTPATPPPPSSSSSSKAPGGAKINNKNKEAPIVTTKTATAKSAATFSSLAVVDVPSSRRRRGPQLPPLIMDPNSNGKDESTPTRTTTTIFIDRLKQQPTSIMKIIRRRQRKRQLVSYLSSTTTASAEAAAVATSEDAATATATATTTGGLSKMDVALFMTYFCNMAVVALSVVTIPALAAEHFATFAAKSKASTMTAAAFVAGVAGMAPLGGAIGKIINGFVCQRFGGRTASWTYLLALAGVNGVMSVSTGIAVVGPLLLALEFLSSIQWTSICHVLDHHYRTKPQLMSRGIALLSLSSTLGALSAKTVGAGLLQVTSWRTVCRLGSLAAVVGAAAMYLGVDKMNMAAPAPPAAASPAKQPLGESDVATTAVRGGSDAASAVEDSKRQSPLSILKTILSNKIFWMVGMAHSLGYLARGSDRILGPFLQEAASLSSPVAAGLTSSVTIGFVGGLIQGSIFSKITSVKSKMKMIRRNYVASLISVLGLAGCAVGSMTNAFSGSSILLAAAITVLSGIMAATVSFQFYQFPNLVSSNVFPENSAVSLSLLDAAGFFFTAQILAANSKILGSFGWSASWSFLALIFGLGGTIMSKAIQPVLVGAKQRLQETEEATR